MDNVDLGTALGVTEGLLFVIVGLPLYTNAVKPNRVYGFRTAATLADQRLWYWANRRMGGRLMVGGALAAFAAMWAGSQGYPGFLVGSAVAGIGAVITGVVGMVEIKAWVRRHSPDSKSTEG